MCGLVGIAGTAPVNMCIYDSLTVLQHRGQDAAGIATSNSNRIYLRKDNGLVKDVFRTRHMRDLIGNIGIGHVRYPTAGLKLKAPTITYVTHGIFCAQWQLSKCQCTKMELFTMISDTCFPVRF